MLAAAAAAAAMMGESMGLYGYPHRIWACGSVGTIGTNNAGVIMDYRLLLRIALHLHVGLNCLFDCTGAMATKTVE